MHVYKIFDKTSWRPKYYCAQDCSLINTSVDDISAINDIKKNTINTAFKSLEELTKSIMLGNAYKKNYINKLIITENYKNIYNS